MHSLGLTHATIRSLRLRWTLAASYVLIFLLLDWVSYIRPLQGLNITPWNPQPALAIALLLWNGRWMVLVWMGLVSAEVVVRGMPSSWFVTVAATAALTLSYAAIARALKGRLDLSLALATRQDLLWFTAIAVGGALFSGIVFVATYAVAGIGPQGPVIEAVARYWVGDAVGSVVMLPMLMVLADPRRRSALRATLHNLQWWLIAGLIGILLAAVFGLADHDHFKYFYILLLPVIWASSRMGLAGAVLAAGLTQVGLIVAVQVVQNPDLTVFELQVLMAAITMSGLMLGVSVDEQHRAQEELRGSLRLAAAGQMAAALAHELSQPLTALSSYAEASRLLVAATDIPDNRRLAQLADVSERMAQDAHRASNVVKRLRDFFRTGSTQLQRVSPLALLTEAVAAQARRAQAMGISMDRDFDPGLRPVLMDAVQVAVVLRNLIANAIDAAAGASEPGRVGVRAFERDAELLIEVSDNGPGVDAARMQTLFDAGTSDKPGGMGVGLSICRAIVEAHGGRLWAEPGPSGRFCFTLPIDAHQFAGEPDAP